MTNASKSQRPQLGIVTILIALVLFCTFSTSLITLYTDYLWFDSLDYTSVFTRRLTTIVTLSAISILIATLFLLFNWSLLPHWIAPKAHFTAPVSLEQFTSSAQGTPPSGKKTTYSAKPLRLLFTLAAIGVGVALGLSLSGQWRTYLMAQHGVPFNMLDPIFDLDLSFYVFRLPWLDELLGRGKTLVALAFIGVALRYTLFGQIKSREATAHLSLLGTLWLTLMGLGWLLNRYSLLKSELGVVFGAGYSDIHARMPLYIVEAALFFIAAVVLVVNAFIRKWKLLLVIGAFWLALTVIGPIYPATVQQFTVEPNEYALEKPYIKHNIRFTRYAYGLDQIQEKSYTARGDLTADELEQHADVLQNVRLWDYRPLLGTYSQLQEIRLYYTFNEVDIDRYVIDGQLKQVMLAAREINVDELAEQAQTWINRHLIFTHGYGLALNSASEVTAEGLPHLLVRDIPPRSAAPELEITRPQIYFGESTSNYILVNTTEQEFDYPQGDTNAYTRYEGPDGVPLGGLLRRTLLATRFSSAQILLSPALSPDSRILFHRTIKDRAETIAPMLWLDKDPYPIIADGGITWLMDAYTWTDHVPYSEPVSDVNYLRNSVKIAIDAYTGRITFYLIDPEDPIAATYARIFPNLFRPASEMPQVLRDHWRYPETLYLYQSHLYATYHMRDPQVFYNREDLWDIPQELVETEQQTMEPYYVTTRTPDAEQLEFMLIRPYVPKQKQNMIAWLYADSDGEDYGQLGVFKLSKERLVYGPLQIEARADQDPLISQQLSLWDQRGSRVLRGNLIVVPIEDTFLYIEPIYLEAASGQLPELKRIIVAYEDRVAMAPTLETALLQVFGEAPAAEGPEAPEGDMDALAQQAWEHYQAAQTCLVEGDWTCYGQAQAALERVLRAMVAGEEVEE